MFTELETFKCPKCKEEDALKCPRCGQHVTTGYGMMGGGIGTYRCCEGCDFFEKVQDEDEGRG